MLQPISGINFKGIVKPSITLDKHLQFFNKDELNEFKALCKKAESINDGKIFSAYSGGKIIENNYKSALICGLMDENCKTISKEQYGDIYIDNYWGRGEVVKDNFKPQNVVKAILEPLRKLYS